MLCPTIPHRGRGEFVWGFDLINMQISHVWSKSYEQTLISTSIQPWSFTDLHGDITEMLIIYAIRKQDQCWLQLDFGSSVQPI